jgi:Mrp family chromosome partitioning ATPase
VTKLPVLAEIGAPEAADDRPWGLRRKDLAALDEVRGTIGAKRVVLITPMKGAEGAALTVAIGLAGVAAAAGTRTVLVECDLERPRLAQALGLEPVPGLHEYLRWEAGPADVVQSLVPTGAAADGEIGPLACVVGGRPSDSNRTLLGLGSFRHVTAKLREAYELTILLGPPLEGAGGALDTVAAQADCSIAALPERPPRRAAGAIGEALTWLKTPPLGAVVAATPG